MEFLYTLSRISIPQFFVKLKINRMFLIFTRGIKLYYTLFFYLSSYFHCLEKFGKSKRVKNRLDPI